MIAIPSIGKTPTTAISFEVNLFENMSTTSRKSKK
jgi:hypothetical protein